MAGMTDEIDEVLHFWLTEAGPEGWYKPDAAIDKAIADRFAGLWQRAVEGGCTDWMKTPRGALALLIVLDQLPRNMFRGQPAAYRGDERALARAKHAIDEGHDLEVAEPERQFFYLPLMHSENLADQERCVRLIKLRLPETGEDNLDHARKHREVIRRFGRFPSRNAALGRRDTHAELQYRRGGGYMA